MNDDLRKKISTFLGGKEESEGPDIFWLLNQARDRFDDHEEVGVLADTVQDLITRLSELKRDIDAYRKNPDAYEECEHWRVISLQSPAGSTEVIRVPPGRDLAEAHRLYVDWVDKVAPKLSPASMRTFKQWLIDTQRAVEFETETFSE